jgi:hypothetical protein
MTRRQKERYRHRLEARGFMRQCTDRQLNNIVGDEKDRARRGGEVGAVAKITLEEARNERERRQLQ